MTARPAMQAADQTRTAAGIRRKAVERHVLDLIVAIEGGASPGMAMQLFSDRVAQIIPREVIRQHRERLQRAAQAGCAVSGGSHQENRQQASGGQGKGQ